MSINKEFPLPKGVWLLKAPKELTCLKSPTRTADFLLNTGASQLWGRGRDDKGAVRAALITRHSC